MDFNGIRLLLFICMIMIRKISTTNNYYDRDIILSPNKTITSTTHTDYHYKNGKILFYHPTVDVDDNDDDDLELKSTSSSLKNQQILISSPKVPWEEVLKYTMYLILRDKTDLQQLSEKNFVNGNNSNTTRNYTNINSSADDKLLNEIINSNYIRITYNENTPMFGDIIVMARGKFLQNKQNKNYYFEEQEFPNCDRLCINVNNENIDNIDDDNDDDIVGIDNINDNFNKTDRNIIAYWMVEKIRQRDEIRGHRYEMKITILPINNNNNNNSNDERVVEQQDLDQSDQQKPKEKHIYDDRIKTRQGRSFILRDNDYPKYFNSNSNKSKNITKPTLTYTNNNNNSYNNYNNYNINNINNNTNNKNNYNKTNIDRTFFEYKDFYRKPYMYQNLGFNLNYPSTYKPELNVGEFYIPPPGTKIPTTFMYPTRIHNTHYPTQYFTPKFSEKLNLYNNDIQTQTYSQHLSQAPPPPPPPSPSLHHHHIRFPENNIKNQYSGQQQYHQTTLPIMNTHLHHHYYLNKNKVPIVTASAYEKENEQHNIKFNGDYRGGIDSLTQNPNPTNNNNNHNNNVHTIEQDNYHTDGSGKQHQQSDYPKYQTSQIYNDQIQIPPHHHHQQQQQQPQLYHVSTPPYHMPMTMPVIVTPSGSFYPLPHQPHPGVIPVTTVQYMQPLQMPPHITQMFSPMIEQTTRYRTPDYQHHHPDHQHHQQNEHNNEQFQESPKQENFKFSEPDPIYHHFQQQESNSHQHDSNSNQQHHDQYHQDQQQQQLEQQTQHQQQQQYHQLHNQQNQNDHNDDEDSHESTDNYNRYPTQNSAQIETPSNALKYKQHGKDCHQKVNTETSSRIHKHQNNNDNNDNHHLTPTPFTTYDQNKNNHLVTNNNNKNNNNNNNNNNKDYNDYDIELTVRDNQSTHRPDTKYPDSINAQLPPLKQGTDVDVPYVETSIVTQKSVSPPSVIILPSLNVQTPSTDKSSSTTINIIKKPRSFQTSRQIARNGEKPVLKWMPKRTKNSKTQTLTRTIDKSDINNNNNNYKNVTDSLPSFDSQKVETYITVSPYTTSSSLNSDDDDNNNQETITKKSFSTSISVQIGNKIKNLSNVNIDGEDDDNDSDEIIEKSPSSNKIELIKADIKSYDTNSTRIHMYKATSESDNENIKMDPIVQSIVNHVKSVSSTNSSNI